MDCWQLKILIYVIVFRAFCNASRLPCSLRHGSLDVLCALESNCPKGCIDGRKRLLRYQAVDATSMPIAHSAGTDSQQKTPDLKQLLLPWQEQQQQQQGFNAWKLTMNPWRRVMMGLQQTIQIVPASPGEGQSAPVLPFDVGQDLPVVNSSSNSWAKWYSSQQRQLSARSWSWLSGQLGDVRRRSLLQLLGGAAGLLSSGSGATDVARLGAGDSVYTAYYNSLMGGGSSDALMQQIYNTYLGGYPATSGSYLDGSKGLQQVQQQQRYINAGNQLAASLAPAKVQVYGTAQYIAQNTQPVASQAQQDIHGLVMQSGAAIPNALASLAEGAATIASTVQPYIQNGQTGPVDVATRAAINGATAKQQFMHGTAVPMASGALTAASNIGNYFGSGFKEGFPEGYQAAMDRRSPYADANLQKQQYEQQPALYLPNSFAPLGAMANITYPCPQSPNTAIPPQVPNNAFAPVGTIIGPGIPCGVNIMLVPRTAVPTNQYAPAVVQPVPTSQPVFPAPVSSPTPIPVTPLPPGGAPPVPGGGTGAGGGLPPNITPPNVRPSPTPGGGTIPVSPVTPPGPTPIPVPPPTSITVPPPTSVTVPPPTPITTTPITPTPIPTPAPGISPTLPGGLQPPNIRTRSYNSYNYMSYESAPLQQQQQQRLQALPTQFQQQQTAQRVSVSGPYASTEQAAGVGDRRPVYSSELRYIPAGGAGSRSGSSSRLGGQQQFTASLLSTMGRRLRDLGWGIMNKDNSSTTQKKLV